MRNQTATQIADELFTRQDQENQFWDQFARDVATGTTTKAQRDRADQLLRRLDLTLARFKAARERGVNYATKSA